VKIVTWNCNGALRSKLDKIDSLSADLYVIQECENPALSTNLYREWAGNYLWIGDNKSKGLGIVPKNENYVEKLNWHGEYQIEGIKPLHSPAHWKTSDLRLFLPFQLNEQYTMLGVWTQKHGAEVSGYIGQLWKYIQIHGMDLCHQKTLVLCDFNSNAVWDKPGRWWSHSGVVEELKGLNLYSLYHDQEGENHGD
jgi:hypothetical protein